jgi:hypothetical protein
MKAGSFFVLAFGLVLLGFAGPASAERPSGSEIRLNAVTAGDQQLTDLDVGSRGRFVAVWLSHTSAAAPWQIKARAFNSDLSARTGEILVATVPDARSAFTGRVGVDRTTGNFVVVWSTYDSEGLPVSLLARRFSASGASLGATLVLGAPGSGRGEPDVARVGPRFVVVWQQRDAASTPDVPSYDILGRRFSAAGAPLGGIFPVAVAAGSQQFPNIAMNASGRFAVVFESEGSIGLGVWTALAAPLLGPGLVSGGSCCNEATAVALADDGRTFVQWANDRIDPLDDFGHNFGVVGVVLNEAGTPVLGPGRVNTFLDGIQAPLTAAVKQDGGFLAGWISFTQDGSGTGLYGRQISSASVGPELRVNTATAGNQLDLRFGTFGNGRGVAAYSTPGVGLDVVARRLVP